MIDALVDAFLYKPGVVAREIELLGDENDCIEENESDNDDFDDDSIAGDSIAGDSSSKYKKITMTTMMHCWGTRMTMMTRTAAKIKKSQ